MDAAEARSRCWAEIDLDALKSNYETALSMLSPGARVICVLKANAYGMGANAVSRALYSWGARFFAVACYAEAREIKSLLPDADVLVMGLVSLGECESAVRNGIVLTCWNEASARLILSSAEKAGAPARVHIKADTGLHRLGFDTGSFDTMLRLARDERVRVEGLYTHLALRNKENDLKQFRLFDRADALLHSAGISGYMRHACDSIGMVRYPERHMDAVRLGAWLYGVCPYRYAHPELDKPVARFMTRISDIHTVRAGDYIGYDEDHPLPRDTRVATLPAGYVDGYPRLNSLGEVIVRGRRARVLGLVCMDQMMVDVTDVPGARAGDEVTLLGDGISLNEYAEIARMNRNECLSRVGRRVPRIYLQGGRIAEIQRDIPFE
ncbi:MAG: alanine racemase [Clostridia bacterium]|nr:alanine racemase [Clostridia bacterium]